MDERDESSRFWFDPSRVELVGDDDVSVYFDDEALIALSGAMSDSVVTVHQVFAESAGPGGSPQLEAIALQIHREAVSSMSRLLRRNRAGDWFIENAKHEFSGKGFSARSLVIQARAGQELGFRYIALDAVGDYTLARLKYPDDRWAGYWVCPRLGFDADVPESVVGRLPPQFQGISRVSDLMVTQEGRDAWELHGDTLSSAKFDLTANSMSWLILGQYLQQRNIKV